ncbi:MAG TPA: hypothetical protein VGM40_04010 [Mycobacterium sp.]|jgi:hypothetical protein
MSDEKLIPKDSCGCAPAKHQDNPLVRVVSACDGCRKALRSRGQAVVKNLVLSAGSDGCQHSNFRKSKEESCWGDEVDENATNTSGEKRFGHL